MCLSNDECFAPEVHAINACMVMKVSTLELSSGHEVFQCVFVQSHC